MKRDTSCHYDILWLQSVRSVIILIMRWGNPIYALVTKFSTKVLTLLSSQLWNTFYTSHRNFKLPIGSIQIAALWGMRPAFGITILAYSYLFGLFLSIEHPLLFAFIGFHWIKFFVLFKSNAYRTTQQFIKHRKKDSKRRNVLFWRINKSLHDINHNICK